MTKQSLATLAKRDPEALVVLTFESKNGTGRLICSAADAHSPNRSMRYFPTENRTREEMGWPVPFWYAHEITGIAPFVGTDEPTPPRPILQASVTMPGTYLLDVDALTQNPSALDDDHEIIWLSTDALRRLQAILAGLAL
ncbi:MAG: hypothetical protein NVS3B16_24770 [Vulcanimicrobiaceae bacterium]